MNFTPEDNPTPGIDEALLDEALREETPEELEQKILALTDPQMLSLLDEAMAAEASDQLPQRILSATQQYMQPGTVRVAALAQDAGVLARIGPSTLRYAAAAAIVLSIGLGVYFLNQGPQGTDAPFAEGSNTPDATADDALPDWLTDDQFASSDAYFQNATDVLEDAAGSLEDVTITRDTLWAELDAYEQFLDDFES
jgi:hypothetical protein